MPGRSVSFRCRHSARRDNVVSVRAAIVRMLVRAVLPLALASTFIAQPVTAEPGANHHDIHFRSDDRQAQQLARTLVGTENLRDEDLAPGAFLLWTAWVKIADRGRPALFVMYGCSPTGNCQLNGFQRTAIGYHRILDSLAQRCSVLSSSHFGRRDLSAYMHGDAFGGIRKTYWWRGGRYVRVSARLARSGR